MKISKHVFRNAGVALTGLGLSLFAGLASAVDLPAGWYATVPEPSVLSMMAAGTATMVILARLKRKK
jgi:hypothetical protein